MGITVLIGMQQRTPPVIPRQQLQRALCCSNYSSRRRPFALSGQHDRMDCSYRWHAKKVLRIPEVPTANQILGRAVHAALAANFDQKCEIEEDLSILGVIAVFREAWTVLSDGNGISR